MVAVGAAITATSFALTARGQDWRADAVASFDLAWQTINDTYYDPAFGGLDWTGVRREIRPKVTDAATPDEARRAIRDMLSRLGQSHFSLIGAADEQDRPRGEASAPFEVRVVGQDVLVTAVHEPAVDAGGIEPGDRLLAIDDVPVRFDDTDEASTARVRDARRTMRIMRALSGASGSTVHVRWRRPDETERAGVVRLRVPDGDLVSLGNLPPIRARLTSRQIRTPAGRSVGFIGFNVWMPSMAEPFARAIDDLRAADALVIDLRGNPGGIADMMRGMAGHLVDEPALIGRMRLRGLDLEFRVNPRRSTSDGRRVTPYAGPVALLVDGLTASASECFAGGLQSLGRVSVFGTTTMGQALPASTRPLPNGDLLMYAVGDFTTSTGRRLEGVGVEPDEIVPLVPADLAAGRDALAAAIGWIDRRQVR